MRDLTARSEVTLDLSRGEYQRLLRHLEGLTLLEAEKILTKAIVEDRRLAAGDIAKVVDAKRRLVEREGLLEYYASDSLDVEVADLASLKRWLDRRRRVIHDPRTAEEHGLPFPRGVLLLGVPGTGKSLSARLVAQSWHLPLLKMDPARLYNRYIGETEKNVGRAIRAAEKMAPVVLWIDEIEKALASGDGDSGVSLRVLGTFLSWLQEREGDVFVVATANDVGRLPPELLRKGRFDEVFFLDLPDPETRVELFRIHLERRRCDPSGFDLERLAAVSDGFSPAEIEQVVISARYTAFAEEREPDTETLLAEVELTEPLSRLRAEEIAELRSWASDRTVPAA